MRRWLNWAVSVSCASLLCLAQGCSTGDGDDSVLPGVEALLFVKRAYITESGEHNVTGGNGQTIDYLRYTPGGGLYVLSPPTPNGTLTNLTEDFEGVDINGVDVSFDGTKAVFAMRRAGDDHYHLYMANIDGSGDVRQLTFGDYHDVKPIFVPGDRIGFVTNQPYTEMGTRADEYNHARVVTQIATVSEMTGDADRRLCSQNLSHSADPFLMSDGRVGFSRWEHLGPVNDVKLFAMNPDCTQMVGLAGQHGKPGNSLVQVEEIREGEFIGVTTSRMGTIQGGALVHIDARAPEGNAGIALDEQNAKFDVLTPQVPTGEESPPSGIGRYRRPRPLADSERFLVSWADGPVNERSELAETAPNYGIYLWDPESRRRTLVYDDPDMWDLYAIPVAEREVPPVYPGVVAPAPDPSTPAVLGSVDVTLTSLNETVSGASFDQTPLSEALQQTRRVRIIEGFSSEIGSVRDFGLTMHEGAAVVGEAPVFEDGSWEASVPSLVPYHLQPLDRYGMSIRNQMLWIQAMPGEERRCGGCHESRTDTVIPRMGPTTLAQQARMADPDDPNFNFNNPIPDRRELPWMGATTGNIQDLFDAKCVGCHSGGAGDPFAGRSYTVEVTTMDGEMLTYQIPYLDLSSRSLEVTYEDEAVNYPASYVTLLYPSAMMGDSMATGDVPPEWVVPGAARESALIAKLNANAEDDQNAWAWDPSENPPHPENVGVDLTREERIMLIQMADLGGQYWTRKNVEGSEQFGPGNY